MANQNFKMGVDSEEPVVNVTGPLWENKKVVNCIKLNIREEPSKTGKIARVVSVGDTLLVDTNYISDEWAKVRLTPKTVGYVMKKYLSK